MELKTCKFCRGLGTPNKRKVYIFPLLAKEVRAPVGYVSNNVKLQRNGDYDYERFKEVCNRKRHQLYTSR